MSRSWSKSKTRFLEVPDSTLKPAPRHGHWAFLWQDLFPMTFSSFHFFLLLYEFSCWRPLLVPSSWDKIFSHFSISGQFCQSFLTWPLLCYPFPKPEALGTRPLSPLPWSWELRQSVQWQESQPTRAGCECAHVASFLGLLAVPYLLSHSLFTLLLLPPHPPSVLPHIVCCCVYFSWPWFPSSTGQSLEYSFSQFTCCISCWSYICVCFYYPFFSFGPAIRGEQEFTTPG